LIRIKRSHFLIGAVCFVIIATAVFVTIKIAYPPRPLVQAIIETNVIAGRNGMGFYAEEFSGPFAVNDPLVNIAAFAAVSRALSSRGVTLTVVIVPIKARIYEDRLPQLLPESISKRYDLIHKALDSNGVHAPDINAYLLNHPGRNSNLPLYFYADTHWTPQAAFDVGNFISKEISERSTLNDVPITPMTRQPTSAQISGLKQLLEGSGDGDLIRLSALENPAHTQIKPLTDILITKLETNVGLLEKTPAPKIVQTGTSYSVNDALANGLRDGLQRDVLLLARDAGSYYPFKEYIANEYQKNPPRAIIWEYPERALSIAFEPRDPARMVADALGWCNDGIKPLRVQFVKSNTHSITYSLEFDHPISGTYLSMRLQAATGVNVYVINPHDKHKPVVYETFKLNDAPTTQFLLDQVTKVPSKNLYVKFETDALAPMQRAKLQNARVCTTPLQ
jgi:alginate O-acetyltransferase complex protein AlgJ